MRKMCIFSWNLGKMCGFRRFLSYKKTVVAVKLFKKLVQKTGINGTFEGGVYTLWNGLSVMLL